MILENLHMLHLMATMLIVCELSLTSPSVAMAAATAETSSSSSLKETEINKPSVMTGMVNRLPRHTVQGLQQQQQQQNIKVSSNPIKRSYSSGNSEGDGGWASMLNSITGLMGSHHQQQQHHHIKSASYDAPTSTATTAYQQQQYTEAKPIYEQHQENDYAGGSGSEATSSSGYGGSNANQAALQSAIYNLQTAGTHNTAVGTSASTYNGGSNGFLPSWNFGKLSTSFIGSEAASTPYNTGSDSRSNNDKISEGNFLHHYDSASAYNEYTPTQHEYEREHEQSQQQQLEQQYENFYNSNEHRDADSFASYHDAESEHDNSNYLPSAPPTASAAGHFHQHYNEQEHHHQQQQEKQPDVINYVPYPVVKKQLTPTYEPFHIPVSHAVIIPVSKPVPIHIPVSQNVQVPVEKELKIPVERVIPYPVEKHIPVPVEKRVPYPVVKYVPIKVPRPFPVKVPVFKTVLHKVKGWW